MKYMLVLLHSFFLMVSYAQKHDNHWLMTYGEFGYSSTQMTFDSSFVLDSFYRDMPMRGANITMSDSLGNLLFYSNGLDIYTAQYQLMPNGDGLNPGLVAQYNLLGGFPHNESMVSLPHPSQANKYYIIHQAPTYPSAAAGFGDKLYYSLVDMNANGGLGVVERKNQVLLEGDSLCIGQLEAVKHGNGRDWWLLQPMAYSNGFHVFLIANNSIRYHHRQYIGAVSWYEVTGQAVFSPSGEHYYRYDYQNDLNLYDFDRCSGYLSNAVHIPIIDTIDTFPINQGAYTGLAVSPNERYLYVSSYNKIYQFDLWTSDIAASKDTVAFFDNYPTTNPFKTFFGYLQLAPDGKIYSHIHSNPYLHVIHQPNQGGAVCQVEQRGVDLYFINSHLPNNPNYRTGALVGSGCDSLLRVVGVEDLAAPKDWALKIYPNPTAGLLEIESNRTLEKQTRIEIYNSIGQLRKVISTDRKSPIVSIDVSDLENGIYFLSLGNRANRLRKTFIVQH